MREIYTDRDGFQKLPVKEQLPYSKDVLTVTVRKEKQNTV